MKQVYSTHDLMHCGILKELLVKSGIKVLLKNENVSGVFGGNLYNPHLAYPELWVEDTDFDKAREVIQVYLESEAAPEA